MIVIDPFMIPEPPIPATARATMNIFEEAATPHSSEPSSNIARKERKVNFFNVSAELANRGALADL
jgi:hypothetical protein